MVEQVRQNPKIHLQMNRPQTVVRLVSEFLVIVISVLVALGIDEWVGNLEDRSAQRTYLEGLKQDVHRDLVNLEQMDSLWFRGALYGEVLIAAVRGDHLPNEASLLGLIYETGKVFVPQTASATYDDLIGSGNLGLIRDPGMRIAISEYYRLRFENLSYFDRLDLRFRLASREILPPRLTEMTRGNCPDAMQCAEPDGFDRSQVLNRLVTYPGIEDMLQSRIRDLVRGAELARQRRDEAADLIERLEGA